MAGPIFLALAALVGAGCAWLAWSQVRRTAKLLGRDPAALARALQRLPANERLGELLRRTEPGNWAHDLAEEVQAIPDEASKVTTINLALSEIERTLAEGADWPRSAVRISLLGALLLAAGAYLADPGQLLWSILTAALLGAAALSCSEAGRAAKRNETAQRGTVDALVAAAFGAELPIAEPQRSAPADPERRTRGARWGRRRT